MNGSTLLSKPVNLRTTSAKMSVTHNIGILLGTRSLFSFISEMYVESHLQFVYIYLIIYHPL